MSLQHPRLPLPTVTQVIACMLSLFVAGPLGAMVAIFFFVFRGHRLASDENRAGDAPAFSRSDRDDNGEDIKWDDDDHDGWVYSGWLYNGELNQHLD